MVIEELGFDNLDSFYKCFSSIMNEGYGQFPPVLSEYFLLTDYTVENFRLWIDRNFRKVYLALDDNSNVIGFIIGDHTYGGVGFVSLLGVYPEYLNKGIGGVLLDKYTEYIRQIKGHLIELYTYDRARPFYERHGFILIGQRPEGYFGRKNLIMNLTLKPFDINDLLKRS